MRVAMFPDVSSESESGQPQWPPASPRKARRAAARTGRAGARGTAAMDSDDSEEELERPTLRRRKMDEKDRNALLAELFPEPTQPPATLSAPASTVPDAASRSLLSYQRSRTKATPAEEALAASDLLKPGFDALPSLPSRNLTRNAEKRARKAAKDATAGAGWFNMGAKEADEETARDLEILRMRHLVDTKRRYRPNDSDEPPKYFQVGRIVEDASDFYSSRVPRKQRKGTLAEEFAADDAFLHRNQQRFGDIQHNDAQLRKAKAAKGAATKRRKAKA